MNRKTKLALALMVLCTPTALSTEGFYAGISIGKAYAQSDITRTTRYNLNYTSNSGSNGESLGAFIGYNHLIQDTPLFIGLEAGVHTHNLNMYLNQDHGVLFSEKMGHSTKYSANGVFKFGVVINDLMVYTKAGVFKSQWRISLEGRHPNNQTFASLTKTNSYGYVCGFGADYKLNDKWSLGIDHTINNSQTLNLKAIAGTFKIDPTISTTSMRLTYTF